MVVSSFGDNLNRKGEKLKVRKRKEKEVKPKPRFLGDDLFYAESTLEDYAATGMDTSLLRRAVGSGHSRGLQVVNEWEQKTADGRLVPDLIL